MAKPPRQSGRKVSLTPATAKRIAACVLAFERGNKDMSSPPMRTGSDGTEIIRGTFTAPWNKGSTATVTDGVLSSVTYKAKNYYTPVTGTGTKDCAIAYVGGEWILIDFDLTQLDGYSSGKTQVLGSVSGALKWIDTTTCT
jgi:hypothetical protein